MTCTETRRYHVSAESGLLPERFSHLLAIFILLLHNRVAHRMLIGMRRSLLHRPRSDARCRPGLGMESLEKRQMLAAELDTGFTAPLAVSPTENVFWKDGFVDIKRGQWIVQYDRDATVAAGSRLQAEQIADSDSWLSRRPPKQLIGVDGSIERRLYEFDDLLVRSAMLHALANSPNVLSVEPNFRLSIDVIPDDPSFDQLWGLDNSADADIDAPEAWDLTTGSSDMVVGVIDTGVDYNHEDLAQNIWVNPLECPAGRGTCVENGIDEDGNGYVDDFYGWDFANNDNDPRDDNSHGTHVAGTIAAVGNNGKGVVGVNWNAKIMAIKFLDSRGSGYLSDAVQAIDYATMMRRDYGINIRLTNNSWGGGGYSQSMYDAIAANRNAGMLFVAAAGNDSLNNDSYAAYPASYNLNNIISVASTTSSDALSSFSNYGRTTVDVGAPGSSIYSTMPNNKYGTKSGTSMASPHVAGIAALAWGGNQAASYSDVRAAIFSGVDPVPALTGKTVTGGRVNAFEALQRMGLFATLASPVPNSIVDTAPLSFTFDFSAPINSGSLNASDVSVNGIPANGFSIVDSDTVEFTFAVSPVSIEGIQTVRIAAGSISQASNGSGISELLANFFYDPTPLRVTAITPADGAIVSLPAPSVQLDFSEPLAPGSIGIDDLVISDGRVESFTIVDSDTVVYHLAGISHESVLSVDLIGGTIADTDGFPNEAFSASFSLDVTSIDYPGIWNLSAPRGSRVRQTSIPGLWHAGDDEDRYIVDLEAGQSISFSLRPDAVSGGSVPAPRLRVLDPGGTPIVDLSGAAGESLVANAMIAPVSGDYTVVVDPASEFGGLYELRMALGAVWETETLSGQNNDTLAASESIDDGWTPTGNTVSQLAVAGSFASANDTDWFSVSLNAGVATTLDVAAPGMTQAGVGPVALSLHSADGTELATGVTDGDVSRIDDFLPPNTGMFFVQLAGSDFDYVLSATAGGTLDRDRIDADRNGSIEDAQPLTLPPRVVGHLGGDFESGPGVDAAAIETTTISLDSSPEGDMIRDVVYTPDGTRYLIAHRDTENLLVYDSATGNLLAEIPVEGKPVDLDVTPDGAYAISANTNGNTVTVIDLATLSKVADIATSSAWPYRVYATADSSRAVVATAGGHYVVISLLTLAETNQFEASGLGAVSQSTHSGYSGRSMFQYTDFVLTPDGTKLVGPGTDVAGSTADIFDLATGSLIVSIPVADESPSLLMTADGSTVYAVSRRSVFESTISEISLATNSLIREIQGPGLTTNHVLLTPDGQELIGGRYTSLQFVNLSDGTTKSVQAGEVSGFAISHDGSYVLARDVIDLSTKIKVGSLPFFSSMDLVVTSPTEMRGFQVSRLTSDQYKLIEINGAFSSVLQTRTGGSSVEGDTPIVMEITADGMTAVTANYGSKNLAVVDLSANTVTRWIDVGFHVDSLAITPDGSYGIASSASTSHSVVVVDLVAGTVDATLTGINFFPRDVAISDDGTQAYVVTTGLTDAPDSLYFIDVAGASSSVVGSIPIGDARSGNYDFTRLQLSPDGSVLAIPVTGSGELVLVDTATRTEIARVATGEDLPTEALFSPDGTMLYVRHQSGGSISAIRIDGSGTSVQSVITGIPNPAAMTIDADGDYLYVATSLFRNTNEVHVVDARSLDVVQIVSLGSDARPTRMHQDGNVIYLVATEEFTPTVFAADAKDTLMRIYAAGVDSELVDAVALSGRSRLVGYSPTLQAAVATSHDQDLIDLVDFGRAAFGDEDYYRFLPQVGDTVTITTSIPGSPPGLIDNHLELAMEVFDPQGRHLATSQTGSLGLNIESIGTHTVRLFSQNLTRGEYVLSIDGATVTAGPSLLGFTPLDGEYDVSPDATLTMQFDEPVVIGSGQITIKRAVDDSVLATIDASSPEITVNGSTVTVTPSTAWELGTDYYVLIDSGVFMGLGGEAFSGIADATLWDFSVGFGFDFGDAPAPYPVSAADAGARHSLFGPHLGPVRDSEPDGIASPGADSDDLTTSDDEDGVNFGSLHIGQIDARLEVDVRNVDSTARIDAWIDFNADGHFGGKGEQIAISAAVVEGTNVIEFDIPAWVASGQTYARVRLSTSGGLGVIGNAPDGEVEDHLIEILPPKIASKEFYPLQVLSPKFSGGKSVVPVDLDGDGDIDLIHPDGSDNNIAWLQNDGRGEFSERLLYSQWNIKTIEATDFDGDGDMDVVYLSPVNDELGWFRNLGNESFLKVIIDNQLSTPQDFTVVDYDQDGDKDVVAVDNFDDVLLLYLNDGDETFTKQTLAGNVDASLLEVADLDRDGDLDFVVNDDGLSWYEQTATGLSQHSIATGTHYAVEVFDVNSDGRLDVASADSFSVNWYANDGAGAFAKRLLLNINSVRAVEFADLDGDGDMDAIAKATTSFSNLSWLENDGAENFQIRTLTDQTNQPVDLATADLDGDSDLDVILSTDFDGVGWIENINGVLLSVVEMTPADGDAMVAPAQDLSIRFDQAIRLGTGNATIHLAVDDSVVETIDVSSSRVNVATDTLTIDPVGDLSPGTDYYLRLDFGAVENLPGDPFDGIQEREWSFRTVASGLDYGDAPDTFIGTSSGNYNTLASDNGPSHVVAPELYLGRIADVDDGSQEDAWAGADDKNGQPDDENSLITPDRDLVMTVGASPVIAMVATNLTDQPATLTGWIDYNSDGVFSSSERAQLTIEPGIKRRVVAIEFPPVPGGSADATFARFRLGAGAAAQLPTGAAGPGEVEDYRVTIRNQGLGTASSSTRLSSGNAGAPALDPSDRFGASLASLGDIDGDGVDDLAISAPGDDDLSVDAGAVYIAMMNPDGSIKSYQKILPNASGLPFDASDQFGTSIASAGDLDHDGINDLYVMSKTTGIQQTASLSRVTINTDGTVKNHTYHLINVPASFPQLTTFAAIGDLDADGNPEFAFGESTARVNNIVSGAMYIMFTADDGSAREFKVIASQTGGGPVLSNFDYFGNSVSSLGDINGDGIVDLAVGAYGDRSVTTNSGAVHILFMNRDGTVQSAYEINGTHPNEPVLGGLSQFGFSLAAIGDLDADGVTELLVGADGYQAGGLAQSGQAFVLYLDSDGSVLNHVPLAGDMGGAINLADSDFFGKSVASAGDLNGDGHVDLVVSSLPGGASNLGVVHTILLDTINAPGVESVRVNDGGSSRSQVTSLEVAFDTLVDHQDLGQAFLITNVDSGSDVGQVAILADDSSGKTIVRLAFAGQSTVLRGGSGAFANSLSDGNYQLTIHADKIRTSDGSAMAADYVWGQQSVDAFFRMFGDTDGDRDVDGQDYGRFALSFLKPNIDPDFDPQFDYDGDGDVDGQDYGRFGKNFLSALDGPS